MFIFTAGVVLFFWFVGLVFIWGPTVRDVVKLQTLKREQKLRGCEEFKLEEESK